MVSIQLWLACIYNQRSCSNGIADPTDKKNLTDEDVLCCCDIATHLNSRLIPFVCLPRARGISEGDLMNLS
uniref:Uncharacterized protein n=1 Tax=Arundo donax TaxID=35708 RepID=A0A0A9C4R8_ARUDO